MKFLLNRDLLHAITSQMKALLRDQQSLSRDHFSGWKFGYAPEDMFNIFDLFFWMTVNLSICIKYLKLIIMN